MCFVIRMVITALLSAAAAELGKELYKAVRESLARDREAEALLAKRKAALAAPSADL